jgi:thiamine biosynthesis lipoprotein
MRAPATSATASRAWQVWGLEASVVVTEPSQLDAAEQLTRHVLDAVDLACSRFRPDSELALLRESLAHGALVTPLLATLMESALAAARWTDGAVDPTLGNDLISLGYDSDFSAGTSGPPAHGPLAAERSGLAAAQLLRNRTVPGWTRIGLDGRLLTVPADVTVDLGASAKAVAADMAAARIASELGCGVLVNLGGDIATSGPAPAVDPAVGGPLASAAGHWQILVQDTARDPAQQVSLPAGHAVATSSTVKRRWQQDGAQRHHILDPRFGLPAETVWRSVSVAAPTALEANAYSTGAIVKGHAAVPWLRAQGISARLVDQRGRTVTTTAWPAVELAGVGSHG